MDQNFDNLCKFLFAWFVWEWMKIVWEIAFVPVKVGAQISFPKKWISIRGLLAADISLVKFFHTPCMSPVCHHSNTPKTQKVLAILSKIFPAFFP